MRMLSTSVPSQSKMRPLIQSGIVAAGTFGNTAILHCLMKLPNRRWQRPIESIAWARDAQQFVLRCARPFGAVELCGHGRELLIEFSERNQADVVQRRINDDLSSERPVFDAGD